MFLLGRAVLVWVFHKSLTTPLSKLHLDQFDRLSSQQINRQSTPKITKEFPFFSFLMLQVLECSCPSHQHENYEVTCLISADMRQRVCA